MGAPVEVLAADHFQEEFPVAEGLAVSPFSRFSGGHLSLEWAVAAALFSAACLALYFYSLLLFL